MLRQEAEQKLAEEAAGKAVLQEEADRLALELAEAQAALNAQSAAPETVVVDRAELLDTLHKFRNRRSWQIYITTHGTAGLESRRMVEAANDLETDVFDDPKPGLVFEQILELTDAQKKSLQTGLKEQGFYTSNTVVVSCQQILWSSSVQHSTVYNHLSDNQSAEKYFFTYFFKGKIFPNPFGYSPDSSK